MKVFCFKTSLLPCLAMAGVLALSSCQDDNYDFDDVDMTVGIGGDGLTLPVSSTSVIKLEDVLELDGSECVAVAENGDYVFSQEGGDVAPARPRIASFVVSQDGAPLEGEIIVKAVQAAGGGLFDITADGKAQSFTYSGDAPNEVKTLKHVDVSGRLSFTVNFPSALQAAVPVVERLAVTLPSYMETSNGEVAADGHTLVYQNVPTGSPFTADVTITGLDFAEDKQVNGVVTVKDGVVDMSGDILVDVKATASAAPGVDGSRLTSSMQMGDVIVTGASGRFNPEINLESLGEVEVAGTPDFLEDGRVCVDLYNPQVILTISSDMPVGGKVSGVIRSYKDGQMQAEVAVPQFGISPSGVSNVCICRRPDDVDASAYTEVVRVDNLSDLIKTVPDRVTFNAEAFADDSHDGYFEFDRDYTVQPRYSIEAPIMFDKGARIVYNDTLDGWHDDIEDFELADGAGLSLSTTVENRVPAYLTVDVKAIDIDGNEMGGDEIAVSVSTAVLASADGETPVETPLSVELKQTGKGAFKRLDGLAFHIEAAASADGQNPVVGKTLNARKHSLVAKDIKVTLKGKIIGDFN